MKIKKLRYWRERNKQFSWVYRTDNKKLCGFVLGPFYVRVW